jgi:hypothetical protein
MLAISFIGESNGDEGLHGTKMNKGKFDVAEA